MYYNNNGNYYNRLISILLTGVYYLFVMIMGAISVLMSIVVISLNNSATIAMPQWVRKTQLFSSLSVS
jgi:hypothetical protein